MRSSETQGRTVGTRYGVRGDRKLTVLESAAPRAFWTPGPELSVFVDESGDLGPDSDCYVLALILHDQSQSIAGPTARLAEELAASGLNTEWAIHTGAAIRGEDVYRGMPVGERKREFNRLFAFARRIPASHQRFTFRKREHPERLKLKGAISRELSLFLRDNAEHFLSFERVIVYYDYAAENPMSRKGAPTLAKA